jgi:putative endonuclease
MLRTSRATAPVTGRNQEVDGRLYFFCEVKTRTTDRFGMPAEAVTHEKRMRIRRLASRFLADSPVRPREIRFDVAAVLGGQVEVIEGAF